MLAGAVVVGIGLGSSRGAMASIGPVLGDPSGSSLGYPAGDCTLGFAFTVNTAYTVNYLGVWDATGELEEGHPVAIWDTSAIPVQLVTGTVVEPGLEQGQYDWVAVPATTLLPGNYIIGAFYHYTPDGVLNVTAPASVDPAITYTSSQFDYSAGLVYPGDTFGTFPYVAGPNFATEVTPEPATLTLLGAGLLALRVRRRKA